MKILVIGRGRCGTKAVAIGLQKLGLDVLHEQMGKHGAVHNEWAHDINGRPLLEDFDYVWHVVREPRANIASMHTFAWTNGPAPQMPMTQHHWNNLTARCAISWYEWNVECEKTLSEAAALGKHTWRFHIEDDWLSKAINILGIDIDRLSIEFPELEKDIYTRKHHDTHPGKMKWSEILSGLTLSNRIRLLDMAERYGYATPEKEQKDKSNTCTETKSCKSNAGV